MDVLNKISKNNFSFITSWVRLRICRMVITLIFCEETGRFLFYIEKEIAKVHPFLYRERDC